MVVIPVNSEYQGDYGQEINDLLKKEGIRVKLDNRNEKLGYRLREAQTKKIPYTLILGDQEKTNQTISYRLFGEKETTTVSKEEFIAYLQDQIENKK